MSSSFTKREVDQLVSLKAALEGIPVKRQAIPDRDSMTAKCRGCGESCQGTCLGACCTDCSSSAGPQA